MVIPFKMQIWDAKARRMYKWDDKNLPFKERERCIASINSSGIVQLNSGKMLFLEDEHICPRYFIGKYDESGNEIYSGDILRELNGVEQGSDSFQDHYDYYLVDWFPNRCGFWLQMLFEPPGTEHPQLENYDTRLTASVIGNKFANPELLTVKLRD